MLSMKVLLVASLSICASASRPRPSYQAPAQPSYSPPPVSQYQAPSQSSQQSYSPSSSQQAPPKYNFEYAVNDEYSGNDYGHQESRDGYDTQGTYYVQLPDGRLQTVNYYVSGDSGFVAEVSYEGEAQYPAHNQGGGGGGYQAPQQSYQKPQQSYKQPQQSYQQPQQSYQQPQQSYQQPRQQPRQQTYQPPSTSYG